MMPFTLEYHVTRNFRWRWFGPVSVLGAFIVLAFLIVINIPLTGYETITTLQDDFNATDSHWFYRFMPFRRPKPGTLCDPHLFRTGDSFTTNYSFFEWNIDSIIRPNAGTSAISYSGTPLTFCDVSAVYLNGNLQTWTIDITVLITCQQDNLFKFTAKTFFSPTNLPGVYSPPLGFIRFYNDGTIDARGVLLSNLIELAATDVGSRTYNAFVNSNFSTPMIISLQANFAFCPISVGLTAECATNPPRFNITSAAVAYSNTTIMMYDGSTDVSDSNPWVLDDDIELPLYNILEVIYAAIRIDLGDPSPNNFILNRTVINSTLYSTFPATQWNPDATSQNSTLYAIWNAPDPYKGLFPPITVSGPAQIQLVYSCQFQQQKYIGPLIVSVIVATLSMFSTGWALYIVIATALAKRQDASANKCDGHYFRHHKNTEPSWSDTCDAYGLKPTDSSPSDPPIDHVYQPVAS